MSDLQRCFAKPDDLQPFTKSHNKQYIKQSLPSAWSCHSRFIFTSSAIWHHRRFGDAARHYLQSPRTRKNVHVVILPSKTLIFAHRHVVSTHAEVIRLYLSLCTSSGAPNCLASPPLRYHRVVHHYHHQKITPTNVIHTSRKRFT